VIVPGSEKNEFVIGVDVGGTKVAAGMVTAAGEIRNQNRIPMTTDGDSATGFAAVKSAIDSLFGGGSRTTIRAIGVCAPGPLDPNTGVVINPPNVPCWRNFPLADELTRLYSVPVKIDNDANAAALAEALWGAGRGYRNVFYACIGTGIGTGIVFDGRIYHGRTGAAAEGGHVSIDYRGPRCKCGKPGCIEVLASGTAIAKGARAKLSSTQGASALLNLAHGDIEAVTSEMVGRAYEGGDFVAREVMQETVEALSLWLSNIVDLLEPDVMILGGGVAAMLGSSFDEIRGRIQQSCVNSRSGEIPLVQAHYGADAGIAGGAALCGAMLNSYLDGALPRDQHSKNVR
jgi:glucokinase